MAALLPTEDTRVYEFINEEYFTQHGHCAGHPVINLGSGDSMLFLDVLPTELLEEKDAFDTMNAEINWNVMNHKGTANVSFTCKVATSHWGIFPELMMYFLEHFLLTLLLSACLLYQLHS